MTWHVSARYITFGPHNIHVKFLKLKKLHNATHHY